MKARRTATLDFSDLKKIGVVLKRALYFITCSGRMMYNTRIEENYICSQLMSDRTQIPKDVRNGGYQQISLFDSGLLEHAVIPQEQIIAGDIAAPAQAG